MRRLLLLGPFLSLGLVLLVLWALVAWFALVYPASLVRDVQDDLRATAQNTAKETDALLREAEGNLRTLDLMLLTRRPSAPGQDATVNLLADTLRESSHGMTDLMLANSRGQVWRIPSEQREPFADLGRDSLLADLGVPGGRSVVVGAPLTLRPGARQVLPVATRLSVKAGDLDAAVAFIDMDSIARLYRARLQRQGMAIFLARDDGLALARYPELPGLVGTNIRKAHPERALPKEAASSGDFSTEHSLDGQDRIVTYQTLQDYPLRVFVSLERDRILAGYLAQRRAVIGFSLLVSVIALGLMAWFTRIQHQLRLREAERQATSDASPLGLFRCDRDGRTLYANNTYLEMLELAPEDLAWGWLQRLPPEDREQARADWTANIQAGEPINRVRRLIRRDGSELLVSARTRPMRVDGRLVAWAGSLTDITVQARQQEAMRRLSAIIDLSPDYIGQTAMDGTLIYLNPAVRRRLDLAPDAALLGLHRQQFFIDDGEARYQNVVLPAARRDGHWHGRWNVRTRAGGVLPVDCTLILHHDDQGRESSVSWMLRDISLELAAERERERSLAVMSAVARSSAVMMLAVDTDEQVLFCNKSFEQRFNIAHRAWEGRNARELLGETHYAEVRPLITRALQGETSLVELRDDGDFAADGTGVTVGSALGAAGRGEPRYVELHYAPLMSEAGQVIGAYGVARDVTEAKQEQIRLLKASNTDPLTELLNRAGFSTHIGTALQRARDRQELVALLYLDLDRFKPVNDEYGHPVGDALLKAVAGRLRHALRPQDLVARLGGDEFAVFLHHVARPEDAQFVADKLVHSLTLPFRIGALELHIGTSVGFCVQWAARVEIDELMRQADAQLYHAKRAGRGRAQGSVCAGDFMPTPAPAMAPTAGRPAPPAA